MAKRIYIIAGEASGDLHGANLIKALRHQSPDVDVRCWGGDLMQSAGAVLVKHYRDLAFMGFAEVLLNIRTIFRNIAFCEEDIQSYRPDILVLIDYPGFNMRIAGFAKALGIRVVYYISPQIWAWKEGRVHQLKKTTDRIVCILPFEQAFYANYGVEVSYVGHPLLDIVPEFPTGDACSDFRERHGLDTRPVIALLPGSRKQEIRVMLPEMLKAAESFGDYQIAIGCAPSQHRDFYMEMLGKAPVTLIEGDTYGLMRCSTAGLVTSGTATLEAALWKMPQVVCYKGNPLSYAIARRLVKVKFISLVNLILDRELVKELIQGDMNPEQMSRELRDILPGGNKREKMSAGYKELRQLLGGSGASAKAASEVLKTN